MTNSIRCPRVTSWIASKISTSRDSALSLSLIELNLWYKINNQPTPPLLPFTLYQNKHPMLLTSQLAPSNPNSLTHSLIHSLQLASKSETLCLWFHGAQQLTLSLQPSSHSVDSLEKSPPKKIKKPFSLLTFSHFSTNRMAQLHWTLFPSSSLLLLLCLLLFSTLAPVTLIRFTGKFLRFHCPIFHGFSNF